MFQNLTVSVLNLQLKAIGVAWLSLTRAYLSAAWIVVLVSLIINVLFLMVAITATCTSWRLVRLEMQQNANKEVETKTMESKIVVTNV